MLVGAGHHAGRIYLPLLAQLGRSGEVELIAVAELASRSAHVAQLLHASGLGKAAVLPLPDDCAREPGAITTALGLLHDQRPFDAMLVASDPRHRSAYFDFACARGIDVFVDKPVLALDGIAHDPAIAIAYRQALADLERKVHAAGIDFVVQAQRRDHRGYLHVRDTIDACVESTGIPVTSVHIQHADGMWVLPDEWERDHHPYRFGFGKIFHSEDHFVDLLGFLLGSTLGLRGETTVRAGTLASFPGDALAIWEGNPLLPPANRHPPPLDRGDHGEYDVHALMDFRDGNGSFCVAHLDLLQNSLSDRDPTRVVRDSYKGIGRIRHERVDIKVSTLLDVQVHSYQSRSTRDPAGPEVGHADHFEILVFRNASLLPGPCFQRLTLEELDPGGAIAHNERARASLFTRFLRKEPMGSALRDHLLTGDLISCLYGAIAGSDGGFGSSAVPLGRPVRKR